MKKKNHNSKNNKLLTFSDKLKRLAATSETEPEKALKKVKVLLEEHPANAILLTIAGNAARNCNMTEKALDYIDSALELEPDALFALRVKAGIEIDNENHENALPFLEKSIELYPEDSNILFLLMFSLLKLKHYDDLFQLFKKIEQTEIIKINSNHLNVYGNALLETAKIQEAIAAFQKSLELEPLNNSSHANLIFAQHYSVTHTAEQILNECKRFQERFRSLLPVKRAVATNRSPGKKIRIGMISDGFRAHPVGSMITYGLAHVPREQIEFFAYSANNKSDHVTEKIKKICTKWEVVEKLSDLELDQVIRNDEIDILFDLAGFNSNTRIKTIMQEPAPIIIKWVGGLISSTGLDAVDYLLSDRVETPLGTDALYTEKLIRLPDDYICFKPHFYTPPVDDLPVLRNGYITFACFNNASKINEPLLQQWARILNSVPNSRLFLKSQGYASTELCQKVYGFFAEQGISQERIRLEQASPHKELLECYNEVDIALDPWPYSGGLTTCEALIMGVPVITLPGPTFAGRHSATHLVNAGMPELVAEDWAHYQQLAISLANDLENLNTIRQNLRFIVLQSPLCDGERFSRSFSNAMRAVWQRYCEGKAPEALVLSDEQVPYFADEEGPVELMHAEPVARNHKILKSEILNSDSEEVFRFDFTGRIVTVDNGTNLAAKNYFPKLIDFSAFSFLLFDPAGEEDEKEFPIDQDGSIQHFPFHALGDGEKTNLYVCVDASQSSTLVPLNKTLLTTGEKPDAATVVAEIPVFTVKADGIAGLTHIDWLLLSGRYEVLSLLSEDNKLTGNSLVMQVNLPVDLRYQGQCGIDSLKHHLAALGYVLLRIDGNKHYDYLAGVEGIKAGVRGSHVTEYSLLFVPSQDKLKQLTSNQREKLAFILHNAYGIHDFTYHVLAYDNAERAMVYLEELGFCKDNQTSDSVDNDISETGLVVSNKSINSVDKNSGNHDLFDSHGNDIRSAVEICQYFESVKSNDLRGIIHSYEIKLASTSRDHTTFFLLTMALLSLNDEMQEEQKNRLPFSFYERLSLYGWESKRYLYEYWLYDIDIIRPLSSPIISVVIIANKFKPEIVDNMRALRQEGGSLLQIIFVNNGCLDEDFVLLKPFVDVWIRTKGNAGAYLARNLGALYGDAPLFLFVDDDGFPMPNFINAHLDAHMKYDLVSLRGCYHQSDRSNEPKHYDLGVQIVSALPLLEGNVSFSRDAFIKIKGWGDYVLFGHGGMEITYRLLKDGYAENQFGYTPDSILLHEYVRGAVHAEEKFKSQNDSWLLLNAFHSDLGKKLNVFSIVHDLKKKEESEKIIICPEISFPDNVASYVNEIYKKADTILEYGSGGSTILAAEFSDKKIISVENDLAWAKNMKKYIDTKNLASKPFIYSVDVGETGKWAKPKNSLRWEEFHKYPLSVWEEVFFENPDVILIDGRFRVACFVTAYLKVVKPTIVLFDDYVGRDYYHIVERLVKPTEFIGRMARFDLSKLENVPREHLEWMIQYYGKVTYSS